MKVLLVGSDDAVRGSLRDFLAELPFNRFDKIVYITISEFDSAQAAHQWIISDPNNIATFDLIITEQNGSGMTGVELLKNLSPKSLPIPAIIYCKDILDEIKTGSLDSKLVFFLQLPLTYDLVKRMMEKVAASLITVDDRKIEAKIKGLESKGTDDDHMQSLENILMHHVRKLLDYGAYAPWISLPSFKLGEAYLRAGKFEEAITFFRRTVEIDFTLKEAHADLALCYRKTGRTFEEKGELEEYLKAEPHSSELLLKIGEADLREGDYESAVEYFHKAIKYHKASDGNRLKAKIHVGLGKAYFDDGVANGDSGKFKNAKDEFNTAIHFDPLLISAYNNLIIVYKKLGLKDEAKAIVARVEKITPDSADGWFELFQVYLYDGETNKAKYSLQKATAYLPENVSLLVSAGSIYMRQFMFSEAIELFEKAIDLNPSDPHIYNYLGICLKRFKHFDKAIQYYHKALKITPDAAYLHYNLGKAYYQAENVSLARKEYEIALKLGGDDIGDGPSIEVIFPDFFNRRDADRRSEDRRTDERRGEFR